MLNLTYGQIADLLAYRLGEITGEYVTPTGSTVEDFIQELRDIEEKNNTEEN